MPDIFDRAQEHIERVLPLQLAVRKPVKAQPNGRCHNCKATINFGLYCDAECREDYERREARGAK